MDAFTQISVSLDDAGIRFEHDAFCFLSLNFLELVIVNTQAPEQHAGWKDTLSAGGGFRWCEPIFSLNLQKSTHKSSVTDILFRMTPNNCCFPHSH